MGAAGGRGAKLTPFQPAHRLIELDCAHRDSVLLLFPFSAGPHFPEKNFAPGWPESDDLQLARPIACLRVSGDDENSQRSFRPCDRARRYLYFPRPTRFHVAVISSPRMILTRLARLGEQSHSDAVFGSILHFTFSGQRFGKFSVG